MTEHRNSRIHYPVALVVGLAAAVLSINGCQPWQHPVGGTESSPNPQPQPQPEPQPQPQGMEGDPTSNAGRTQGYIASLEFSVNLPDSQRIDSLECKPATQCGGKSWVQVRVTPEGHSHFVHWGHTLNGGNGHVLSRITNMDTVAYGPWGLPRNDTAYLWIGEIPKHERDLGIFHKDSASAFSFIKIATFKGVCPGPAATIPAAHLYHPGKCHGSFARGLGNSNRLASKPDFDFTRMLGHDQGLWQGCPQGCCETAFF